MKEIIINVKLKIQDDLDEQDILDQLSQVVTEGICHESSIIEFIDAELAETPGSAGRQTGIVVIDIIDDLIKVWGELKHDTRNSEEDAAYCRGAENIMKALKRMLEQYNLAELVPAAEVDQVRGENLTQSMRLDKAIELLIATQNYLEHAYNVYGDHAKLADDIAEFLNADETPGNAGLRTGIAAAEVTYNHKSGKETARTALENVLHRIEKYVDGLEKLTETKVQTLTACRTIKTMIEFEKQTLES